MMPTLRPKLVLGPTLQTHFFFLRRCILKCVERDWKARFGSQRIRVRLSRAKRMAIAGGYWAALMVASFAMWGGGWVIGEGSVLIVALTLPSSFFLLEAFNSFPLSGPTSDLVHSTGGMFVLFPLVCGGLNALLLYGLFSLIRGRQNSTH